MSHDEGNKPALSWIEQREQQRALPEPLQLPAPYVQPYCRQQAHVPPTAWQPSHGVDSTLTETSLHSYLAGASFNDGKTAVTPAPAPSGFTHDSLARATSCVAASMTGSDIVPGAALTSTHIAHLLAYTQQQLTHMQQIQFLLLQHMGSLSQPHAASGVNSPARPPAPGVHHSLLRAIGTAHSTSATTDPGVPLILTGLGTSAGATAAAAAASSPGSKAQPSFLPTSSASASAALQTGLDTCKPGAPHPHLSSGTTFFTAPDDVTVAAVGTLASTATSSARERQHSSDGARAAPRPTRLVAAATAPYSPSARLPHRRSEYSRTAHPSSPQAAPCHSSGAGCRSDGKGAPYLIASGSRELGGAGSARETPRRGRIPSGSRAVATAALKHTGYGVRGGVDREGCLQEPAEPLLARQVGRQCGAPDMCDGAANSTDCGRESDIAAGSWTDNGEAHASGGIGCGIPLKEQPNGDPAEQRGNGRGPGDAAAALTAKAGTLAVAEALSAAAVQAPHAAPAELLLRSPDGRAVFPAFPSPGSAFAASGAAASPTVAAAAPSLPSGTGSRVVPLAVAGLPNLSTAAGSWCGVDSYPSSSPRITKPPDTQPPAAALPSALGPKPPAGKALASNGGTAILPLTSGAVLRPLEPGPRTAGAVADGAGSWRNSPPGDGPPSSNVDAVRQDTAEPEGSELESQLQANRKDLFVFPAEEDPGGDGDDDEAVKPAPWYRRPGALWFLGLCSAAVVLAVVGVCLQTGQVSKAAASGGVFRWLYFAAGSVPVYWLVDGIVARIFGLLEWVLFRENLTYLDSVQDNTTCLATMLLDLLWFQACFSWLWCGADEARCQAPSYQRAVDATWKAVLCVMLCALANVVKAVLAKLSSLHFYRTAHFKKIRDSLEKEYYLQLLSVSRSQLISQLPPGDQHHKELTGSDAANAASDAVPSGAGPGLHVRTLLARPSTALAALGRLSRPVTPQTRNLPSADDILDTSNGGSAGGGGKVTGGGGARGTVLDVSGGAANNEATVTVVRQGDGGRSGGESGGADMRRKQGLTPGSADAEAVPQLLPSSCIGDASAVHTPSHGDGSTDAPDVTVVVVTSPRTGRRPTNAAAVPAPPAPPSVPMVAGTTFSSRIGAGGAGVLGLASGGPLLTYNAAFMDDCARGAATCEKDIGVGCADDGGCGGGGGGGTPPAIGPLAPGPQKAAAPLAPPALSESPRVQGARGSSQQQQQQQSRQQRRQGRSGASGGRAVGGSSLWGSLVGQTARSRSSHRSSGSGPIRRVKSFVGDGGTSSLAPGLRRRLLELGAAAVNAVPLEFLRKKSVHDMTEAELEKVRDAIVVKTCSALLRQHPAGDSTTATAAASEQGAEQDRLLRTVRRFARALYFNIRGPDPTKTNLTRDDFSLFFSGDHLMARRAFDVFDAGQDGKVSRQELRDRVVAIYSDRRNWAASLRDTDSIVRSLELSLGAVIHFLFGAIYLTIWGVPLLQGFSAFSATVLALTFVFGNAARNAFESVLFLFFEHPYDVGDMVSVNGESMRVKRISLLYTDFVKWTNEELYIPNTRLMTMDLTNWTRSRTKYESHKILLDVGVPWDVKQDIADAITAHCAANAKDFTGVPKVSFQQLADPLKVYMSIGYTYNCAPDDFERLGPARDKLMFVIQSKLAEHRLASSSRHINHVEASQEIMTTLQMQQLHALAPVAAGGGTAAHAWAGAAAAAAGRDTAACARVQPPFVPPAVAIGTAPLAPSGAPVAALSPPVLPLAAPLQYQPSLPAQWRPPPSGGCGGQFVGGGGGAHGDTSGGGGGSSSCSAALPALGAQGLQLRAAAAAAAAAAVATAALGGDVRAATTEASPCYQQHRGAAGLEGAWSYGGGTPDELSKHKKE